MCCRLFCPHCSPCLLLLCLLSTFLSILPAIVGTTIELTSVDCLAQCSNLVFLQELSSQLPSGVITACLYLLVKYSGQTTTGKPPLPCISEIYCICLLQSSFTTRKSVYSVAASGGHELEWLQLLQCEGEQLLSSFVSVSFPCFSEPKV